MMKLKTDVFAHMLNPTDPATQAIADQRARDQADRVNRMTPDELRRAMIVDEAAVFQLRDEIVAAGHAFYGAEQSPEVQKARAAFLSKLTTELQRVANDAFAAEFPDGKSKERAAATRAFFFAYFGAASGIAALERVVLIGGEGGIGTDIRASAFHSVAVEMINEVSCAMFAMRGGSVDSVNDMRGKAEGSA